MLNHADMLNTMFTPDAEQRHIVAKQLMDEKDAETYVYIYIYL